MSACEPGRNAAHADVDLEAALHLADDHPFDHAVVLECLLDVAPHLRLLGLAARQHDAAVLAFVGIEEDIDLVAFVAP